MKRMHHCLCILILSSSTISFVVSWGSMNRFLDNKDDIAKVRKCFAGLWSLEDWSIVKDAIERPGLYVMKPQREGGGMASVFF